MTLMRDALTVGSSPLARGLLIRPVRRRGVVGIIPARAGFTDTQTLLPRKVRDHPRSRGVYGCAVYVMPVDAGSSPLARGLLRHLGVIRVTQGIISARAGFTIS